MVNGSAKSLTTYDSILRASSPGRAGGSAYSPTGIVYVTFTRYEFFTAEPGQSL